MGFRRTIQSQTSHWGCHIAAFTKYLAILERSSVSISVLPQNILFSIGKSSRLPDGLFHLGKYQNYSPKTFSKGLHPIEVYLSCDFQVSLLHAGINPIIWQSLSYLFDFLQGDQNTFKAAVNPIKSVREKNLEFYIARLTPEDISRLDIRDQNVKVIGYNWQR